MSTDRITDDGPLAPRPVDTNRARHVRRLPLRQIEPQHDPTMPRLDVLERRAEAERSAAQQRQVIGDAFNFVEQVG